MAVRGLAGNPERAAESVSALRLCAAPAVALDELPFVRRLLDQKVALARRPSAVPETLSC